MRDASDTLQGRREHNVSPTIRDAAPSSVRLGEEQRKAFEHVTSAAGLSLVVGFAGTGKSTMLGAAREAWEAQGLRVRGSSLSSMAARSLQDGSRIRSRTLASMLYGFDTLGAQAQRINALTEKIESVIPKGLEQRKALANMKSERDQLADRFDAARLTKRDVVVLDEAAMVGSRDMKRLLQMASEAGAKVVLVGDAEQLQAIDAGGAFRALRERHGAIEITASGDSRPSRVRNRHQRLRTIFHGRRIDGIPRARPSARFAVFRRRARKDGLRMDENESDHTR